MDEYITIHIQEAFGDRSYTVDPGHPLYDALFGMGEQLEHELSES